MIRLRQEWQSRIKFLFAQFSRTHAIYLEADSGYFGHKYQPFRCLSNRENHRIVLRKRIP